MARKRRRGVPENLTSREKPQARESQPGTLTLEALEKTLSGAFAGFSGLKATELERCREAVEEGNLLAIYCALEVCYMERFGWPGMFTFHYSSRPQPRDTEVPRWLLLALLKHVWRGLYGKWPTARGRHSTAVGELLDRRAHLARAHDVLQLRAEGVPWENVYKVASDRLAEAGKSVSPGAYKASYEIVAKAHRAGKLRTLHLAPRFDVPQEWGP